MVVRVGRMNGGKPDHPYPNSRRPYVRWQAHGHGHARDIHGNKISKHTEEAHIPVEDFRFDIKPFEDKR